MGSPMALMTKERAEWMADYELREERLLTGIRIVTIQELEEVERSIIEFGQREAERIHRLIMGLV